MVSKRDVRSRLSNAGLYVRISKDGVIHVKCGFFYRMGKSAEDLKMRVLQIFPNAVIVSADEHWNTWPRDSYWQVDFTLPEGAE